MLTLEPLMTFANAVTTHAIGDTPFGARITYVIGEGSFSGPRLCGAVLPGGGDWMTCGADGLSRLDVRKTLRTDDGALIDLRYTGLYRFDDAVNAALAAGRQTGFGDTLFVVQAQFATGDPRYAWLNHTLAVGEAREGPGGVEYRLYEMVQAREPG